MHKHICFTMIVAAGWFFPLVSEGSLTDDIANYGAIGDGKTLNTKAIQAAVNDCAAKGGGTVVVPAGTFISGSVELKSHITLFLGPGSVLGGSDKLKDYPPLLPSGLLGPVTIRAIESKRIP
jgi:polygalacturonase